MRAATIPLRTLGLLESCLVQFSCSALHWPMAAGWGWGALSRCPPQPSHQMSLV